MLRVYRGWIFTPESTEERAKAQKGSMTIRGEYHDVVTQIDKYEYAEAQAEEGIRND